MDSTAVYDSGNASDSEVWSSSEGEEQVIEISSHSRILISPRKARSSAWGEKSQRSGRRRVSTGKKRSTRVLQNASVVGSPHSQTSRHSGHAKRLVKSYWPDSPRTTPSDNQPATSNNKQHSEGDESDGDIASDQEDEDLSSDSCGSLGDAESPVHRRVPRSKHGVNKTTKSAFKYTAATSLNDSMQSLDSPTTPGKEMEELKATLKKLARHDDSGENPISQKVPDISSATALHEYLTAATALGGVNALEKTRPVEYPGLLKTRHTSFLPPRKSPSISTGSAKPRAKSMHETADNPRIRRGSTADKLNSMLDSPVEAGNDRLSFNKKLFGKPPPPFEGPGKYVPGLAFPVPASSNSRAGSGGVGGGAQGSRAMLSALKALQDKISRLEEERGALKHELSEAKLSARKREAELASSEKKFAYELGQTKESARAAYDALRCDREELKLQLVKSEERRKATQVELQHFQELTKTFSAKADDLQAQLQISESHRARLKAEMKESESEHKRLVNELQTELTQVRQEQQDAAERIQLLEAQVERESSNHAESRERLKDSEQTVASISQLNEKLVAKVMEATETANQAIKRNKKLQQQIRPSTLLKPTAASRASAAAVNEAASRRAGSSAVAQGNSSARTLKKKKTSAGTASGTQSAAKKTKKAKAVNNMTLLREANLGKEIPFLLGSSVQPSFSVIGNVQDALRRCDTTYVMPTLLGEAPTTPGSTSSHRNTTKKTHSTTHTDAEATNPEEEESVQQLPRSASPPSDEPPVSTTPKANAGAHRRSTKHKPPAIKVPTASPKSYASPMQSQIMQDLAAAVDAAEKEFKSLNKRYKDLVAQMEANNRRGAPGSESAKGNNLSAQLSQALGPLLDDLEAKAKQLNLLKQVYQQASNSTINPPRHVVLSPEAIRRKTASLRLLNEFRQLESDSKNKGSGRSASPSATMGFFH